MTFAVYAALAGALFLLPVQLQLVAGFSPVEAGAATLPITVMMLLLSARMGRLSARIGPRLPMTVGPIIAGLAMVWLTRVGRRLHLSSAMSSGRCCCSGSGCRSPSRR